MTEDTELLRRYVEDHSQVAFAELVKRHVGLVYAAALRQLNGATHRAEDVTQSVFIDLARQARSLTGRTEIAGWLYTSTHYAAAKLKRGEQRRQSREQEAQLMHEISMPSAADANWDRLKPVLDDVMHELSDADREVILLRFFQGQRFADVGRKLGLSDDAARMRVDRALEKLRGLLNQRQITSTTAALGLILANQPTVAVPAALAASVTSAALTGVAVGAGSAAAVGTFFMTTKMIATTAAAALAFGFAIYEFNEVRDSREKMAGLVRERDDLQAQLRGARQQVAVAGEQTAALQREMQTARAAKQAAVLPPPTASAPAAVANAGGTFTFRATSADPVEMRRQVRALNGRNVDSNYAALYRQLGWTPAQREQFRELMLDREESGEQLFKSAIKAARAQNPNLDRAGQFEVFEAAQAQMRLEQQADVRRTFGDAVGQAMENYQSTLPMRSIANQLATALFNSDTPLIPAQADQLVEIMAQNARSPMGKVEIAALNTEAVLAQAQGLLNPAQLVELQQLVVRAQEQKKAERERNAAPAAAFNAAGK